MKQVQRIRGLINVTQEDIAIAPAISIRFTNTIYSTKHTVSLIVSNGRDEP